MNRLNRFRDDCRILLKYSRDGIGILETGSKFSARDRNSLHGIGILFGTWWSWDPLLRVEVPVPLGSSCEREGTSILLRKWSWWYSNPLANVAMTTLESSSERGRDDTRILFWTWPWLHSNSLVNVVEIDLCFVRAIREIKSTFESDSYVFLCEKRSYLRHSHYDPRSNAVMYVTETFNRYRDGTETLRKCSRDVIGILSGTWNWWCCWNPLFFRTRKWRCSILPSAWCRVYRFQHLYRTPPQSSRCHND